MSVITNLNTRQTPVSSGLTGTQVVKFIDAPRVYIKATDSTPTPVTTKSNGTTPSGWTDLGIVRDKVKITYAKEIKEIRTGIDNVLRAIYVDKKTGKFEFNLSQFDDVVLQNISGLTPSTVSSGSAYSFALGSEADVVTKALLLVVQNKLDGKEWQFYHPGAYVTFTIEDSGDETYVKGSGDLPMFTYGSTEAIIIPTIFA